jgi:glucose dehydrogenase
VVVLKTLLVAVGVTLWLPLAAQSAEESNPSPEGAAPPPKCLEAVVNPVTGYAFCTNPRGAPVEQPSASALHPCKPRGHDHEDWTVYEHWSGCGD